MFQIFPIIFFWWKIYSFFPIIFIYKNFNFCYSLVFVTAYWKNLLSFLIDRIYCCFFVFHPVRRISIWSTTIWIYFVTFITCRINEHNQRWNLLPFTDSSNLFWYIFLSDSKSFSITSSASPFIMVSMLSFFDCLSRSSSLWSLEQIKLILIAKWIFHVSDTLRSFMISFKYGLTSLRYSSTW